MFYLIRHGETDYSERGTKIYQGHGENLAPLTERGIQQILETAKDPRLKDADIIISSPYTRAIHTSAILSKELQINIRIETDIHEWQADIQYNFLCSEIAEKHCKEFNIYDGVYPKGISPTWENNEMLKNRLHSVLDKYKSYEKIIVVCHGMLIHSVYQDHWLENGEIVEYIF